MSKRDYYDVLGVAKGADDTEIKQSYRKLAKQYHPDINKSAGAEDKFKEVQEAYDVLGDSQKKAQYDQFGHAGAQGGFGGGFGQGGYDFDMGDIFSSFFGGGSQRQQGGNRPRKGADIQKRLTITFEESVTGIKRNINIAVHEECHTCHGTGAASKKDIKSCSKCRGTGSVVVEQQTIFGTTQTRTTCPSCNGTGKKITKKCNMCHGSGTNKINKDIEVKVPAGIDTGQQIRLEGYGNKGQNGGPNGDLYILVDVKKHPGFARQGDDVVVEVPISFSQAALGCDIEVPTPYGKVKLNVKSGTQSGTTYRLKDKGMPNVRTKIKGVLHVILDVITPTRLTAQQTRLLQQLGTTDETKGSSVWTKFKNTFKIK